MNGRSTPNGSAPTGPWGALLGLVLVLVACTRQAEPPMTYESESLILRGITAPGDSATPGPGERSRFGRVVRWTTTVSSSDWSAYRARVASQLQARGYVARDVSPAAMSFVRELATDLYLVELRHVDADPPRVDVTFHATAF